MCRVRYLYRSVSAWLSRAVLASWYDWWEDHYKLSEASCYRSYHHAHTSQLVADTAAAAADDRDDDDDDSIQIFPPENPPERKRTC